MSWITKTIASSIGKKSVMAASGAGLSLFLLVHLAGNAASLRGREAYNTYAEHLHGLGFLLRLLESGLLFFFLVHILLGLLLFLENRRARPRGYAVRKAAPRRWAVRTMPYTGAMILLFLLVHLSQFHFGDRAASPAETVRGVLASPVVAFYYLLSLGALTLHVSHGFWSMLQSLGLSHLKYETLLQKGSLIASLAAGGCFMLIPALALLSEGFLR